MQRDDGRWQTHLGRWVCTNGVLRIARDLRSAGVVVTDGAIYSWVSGRVFPRRVEGHYLLQISNRELTGQDLFDHAQAVRPLPPVLAPSLQRVAEGPERQLVEGPPRRF
jgi:hypothetical protein